MNTILKLHEIVIGLQQDRDTSFSAIPPEVKASIPARNTPAEQWLADLIFLNGQDEPAHLQALLGTISTFTQSAMLVEGSLFRDALEDLRAAPAGQGVVVEGMTERLVALVTDIFHTPGDLQRFARRDLADDDYADALAAIAAASQRWFTQAIVLARGTGRVDHVFFSALAARAPGQAAAIQALRAGRDWATPTGTRQRRDALFMLLERLFTLHELSLLVRLWDNEESRIFGHVVWTGGLSRAAFELAERMVGLGVYNEAKRCSAFFRLIRDRLPFLQRVRLLHVYDAAVEVNAVAKIWGVRGMPSPRRPVGPRAWTLSAALLGGALAAALLAARLGMAPVELSVTFNAGDVAQGLALSRADFACEARMAGQQTDWDADVVAVSDHQRRCAPRSWSLRQVISRPTWLNPAPRLQADPVLAADGETLRCALSPDEPDWSASWRTPSDLDQLARVLKVEDAARAALDPILRARRYTARFSWLRDGEAVTIPPERLRDGGQVMAAPLPGRWTCAAALSDGLEEQPVPRESAPRSHPCTIHIPGHRAPPQALEALLRQRLLVWGNPEDADVFVRLRYQRVNNRRTWRRQLQLQPSGLPAAAWVTVDSLSASVAKGGAQTVAAVSDRESWFTLGRPLPGAQAAAILAACDERTDHVLGG